MSRRGAPAAAGRRLALLFVLGGAVVFALGAGLARAVLPEWRLTPSADRDAVLAGTRALAQGAGFTLAETPRVRLELSSESLRDTYARLGEQAPAWLAEHGRAGFLTARARLAGDAQLGEEFEAVFTADGSVQSLAWHALNMSPMEGYDERRLTALAHRLAAQLLGPGESLPPFKLTGTTSWQSFPVQGAAEPAYVEVLGAAPSHVAASRNPGSAQSDRRASQIRRLLVSLALGLPLLLAAAGLFWVLLARSRIDLVNGLLLGLLTLLTADSEWIPSLDVYWIISLINLLSNVVGRALWVFFVWSAAESLLRTEHPDFSTSLDLLRKGRIGPRAGRALLGGLGVGAALAGLKLAVYSAAVALPGVFPAGSSVKVPIFREEGGPLGFGISVAAGVALLLALAGRFLPRRWVVPTVAVLGGLILEPVALQPWPWQLAAGVALIGALAWLGRRLGLTALLSASVASLLLPSLLYAGLHRDWLFGSFVLTAAMTATIAVAGIVGLARPVEVESRWVEPPAFIRRLEQERRVEHEMKLLAAMQAGLLPLEMPRLPGWEVAARSHFAEDAGNIYDAFTDDSGQLWISAGDVAGRGYACAIAQAMIKAGLASLAEPGESPAAVLGDLDRVLRTVDSDRTFTTLTLVRLDPESGTALLANAGQPPALLLSERKVREIAVGGLPLGEGGARTYTEQSVVLPPGAALVLCSDGLLAALDGGGHAYGLSRVAELLALMDRRPALEIVDTLLNDCRRHVGSQTLPDDLTVVVVRRSG